MVSSVPLKTTISTKLTYICPHMMQQKQIALLFFSRNASAEGRKKAWFSAGEGGRNKTLATSLIAQTHQVLIKTGLPIFHIHEGLQHGETFGQRLANAYQSVFDLGYYGVIAVGNDTPGIDLIDWQELSTQLKGGHCIIGPTYRRGAYLIGITADLFDKRAFQELPWCSRGLFQALVQFCSGISTPFILSRLRDINRRSDLTRLLTDANLNGRFISIIRNLLFPTAAINGELNYHLRSSQYLLGHAHFRAPPLV